MNNQTKYFQQAMQIAMPGRGTRNIMPQIRDIVEQSGVEFGLCHVFIRHTSASLIVCENADPDVRTDLETFMSKLVVDGDPMFSHVDEGVDDMPAHVRSILTQAELTLPVNHNTLDLGVWQGVYLWEHRYHAYERHLTVTVHGQTK